MSSSKRNIILDIIKQVLLGQMNSVDILCQQWPEEQLPSFYEVIFDHAEGVIEHLKVPLSTEINEYIIQKEHYYRNLVIDYLILSSDIQEEHIPFAIEFLLSQNIKSTSTAQILIERLYENRGK